MKQLYCVKKKTEHKQIKCINEASGWKSVTVTNGCDSLGRIVIRIIMPQKNHFDI